MEAVVKLTVSDYEKLQPTQKRQLIAAYQLPIRKTAHVLEFALLGLLLMFAWAQYPLRFSLRLTLSFTMALAVAILDETLQRGVSGRSSDFVDVGFDALGIILGAGLTLVFSRVRHGAKRKVKG